jgi:hypothetical protein
LAAKDVLPVHFLMSSTALRFFAGVAIQPFLAGVCAFFMFPVLLLDGHGETLAGGRPADSTEAALSVALVTGVLALIVGFTGAITAAAWRTRRGLVSLGEALLFGLGFGNLPYVMLAIAAGGTYGVDGLLRGVAFSSGLGLTGATVFWVSALRRPRSTSGVAS